MRNEGKTFLQLNSTSKLCSYKSKLIIKCQNLKGSRNRLHVRIKSKETSHTSYKRVDKSDLL